MKTYTDNAGGGCYKLTRNFDHTHPDGPHEGQVEPMVGERFVAARAGESFDYEDDETVERLGDYPKRMQLPKPHQEPK